MKRLNFIEAFVLAVAPFIVVIGVVLACGKDPEPVPPIPPANMAFSVVGKFSEVKGTAKTVTAAQAKLAVVMAFKNLEGK